MKIYKLVPKHVEQREQLERALCDRCHKPLGAGGMAYDQSETTIEARLGDVYPERDHRTAYAVDCCPECFVEHVLPALKAIGFTVREWDSEKNEPHEVTGPT